MALATTSPPFQQVNMPALDLRRALHSGWTEGVVAAGDMAAAQRAAGANMSVDIAAGEAYVLGEGITNQGLYYAYNDAVFNLTGFTAAHATLPRVDRVALRVRDAFHGDAANDLAFVIVTGTATTGATLANLTGAAAIPANHLLLANVLVPATATSVTTANIDTTVRLRAGGAGTTVTYAEFTANVTVTATTEATANTVVTAPAVAFDGATSAAIVFFCTGAELPASAGAALNLWLYDGASSIGLLGQVITPAAAAMDVPVHIMRVLTPSAATKTYSLRASVSSGTGTMNAGAGGTGFRMPGFIRVTKA